MFDLETIKAINTPGYKWQHTEPIVSKPTMSDSESRVRLALQLCKSALDALHEENNVYSRHEHRSA
jgi:hypothetical protein